jgi:hypothetical protein
MRVGPLPLCSTIEYPWMLNSTRSRSVCHVMLELGQLHSMTDFTHDAKSLDLPSCASVDETTESGRAGSSLAFTTAEGHLF